MAKTSLALAFVLLTTFNTIEAQELPRSLAQFNERLRAGHETRIVCFGDSITGVYYHTGGQRAWCDMLGVALQQANPRANLRMINSGISGHTTVNALARMQRDVIANNPHLVVVMFGMNDVVRVPLTTYEENLRTIVQRCADAGADVVLCTPNSVYENTARPNGKLAKYSDVVRAIGNELKLRVVDCFANWQAYRKADPDAWSLLMSDDIHPNMLGHQRFAELITKTICGKDVSLASTSFPYDALHHTFDRLDRNEHVNVVAMSPYDELIPKLLKRHFSTAKFQVTTWPTTGKSVAEISEWGKRVRGMKPHLVVPAIPTASLVGDRVKFTRDYEWVLNYSFQFGGRPWDVVPVSPAVEGQLTTEQRALGEVARQVIRGKDIRFVDRDPADTRASEEVVSAWIDDQLRAWRGSRNRLPATNDKLLVPVQAWPHRPGPRSVRVSIHYPGGRLANVNDDTGIMLTLHNWGGEDCAGTANPDALAKRLNVVGVCVNYLQSGRNDSIEAPEPYDCGYLQAIDALRALAFVRTGLRHASKKYDDGRLYCVGGSGGGNVTLMANKLAPRTFACVIDMCGMKKLSDDIAFNEPGGTGLNARWTRDKSHVNYLTPDAQAIRFIGNPQHLKLLKPLRPTAKMIIVHGVDDTTCPFADAEELVANLQAAKYDVEPHFIDKGDIDGRVFTSSGHPLGNRTEIVFKVAGQYLEIGSEQLRRRSTPTDFDLRESLRFPTENGTYEISYESGVPVGSFVPE